MTVTLTKDKSLKPLTEKEHTFLKGIFEGKSQIESYKNAYNKHHLTNQQANSQLFRVLNREHIKRHIAEHKKAGALGLTLTLQERRLRLAEIINDRSASYSDVIKAIMADSALAGDIGQRLELTELTKDGSSLSRLKNSSIQDKIAFLRQQRERERTEQARPDQTYSDPAPALPDQTEPAPAKPIHLEIMPPDQTSLAT